LEIRKRRTQEFNKESIEKRFAELEKKRKNGPECD